MELSEVQVQTAAHGWVRMQEEQQAIIRQAFTGRHSTVDETQWGPTIPAVS